MSMVDDFRRIGTEALAVRHIELSMISEATRGHMTPAAKVEWDAILDERREHLNRLIDDLTVSLNMAADLTLESIYADRKRRSGK